MIRHESRIICKHAAWNIWESMELKNMTKASQLREHTFEEDNLAI